MAGLPSIRMTTPGTSTILTINPVSQYSPYFSPNPSWNLGIACTVSSGASLTYQVELTCDPTPSSSGNWNAHDTMTGLTASTNGNIAFPITGLRLNVTNYVSGSVNMGVAQWP